MTLVADASAVVAFLIDDGDRGRWAETQFLGHDLAAPSLVFFEVGNALRSQVKANRIDESTAARAHVALLAMPVLAVPYELLAERAWELKENFTVYDASYVALAERLGATLVTLDARLARGPGLRCQVLTYETRPDIA